MIIFEHRFLLFYSTMIEYGLWSVYVAHYYLKQSELWRRYLEYRSDYNLGIWGLITFWEVHVRLSSFCKSRYLVYYKFANYFCVNVYWDLFERCWITYFVSHNRSTRIKPLMPSKSVKVSSWSYMNDCIPGIPKHRYSLHAHQKCHLFCKS